MGNTAGLCRGCCPKDTMDASDEDPITGDALVQRAKIREAVTRCSQSLLSAYDHEGDKGQRVLVQELHTIMTSLHQAIAVVNKLSNALDFEQVMDNVRNVALELLGCERVTLFIVDEVKKELRAKTASNRILMVKFGEGIAGAVADTGQSMNVSDVYSCPQFSMRADEQTGFVTRNILCWPVADLSGKNVAVLQAVNKKGGRFAWIDENALELFAVHIGNAVVKSQLHEKALYETQMPSLASECTSLVVCDFLCVAARREQYRIQSLNKCFKSLSASSSLNEVACTISNAVKELVSAEHAFLFLMDQGRRELWARDADKTFTVRTSLDGSIVGSCATSKGSICTDDPPENDSLIERLEEEAGIPKSKCLLLEPIMDGDNTIAVILAINKVLPSEPSLCVEECFTETDCQVLSVLSHEVEGALVDRSLEMSFASALSTVTDSGCHPSASQTLLQSQLLEYSAGGADYMLPYRTTSEALDINESSFSFRRRILSEGYTTKSKGNAAKARRRSDLGPPDMMKFWDIDFTELPKGELVKVAFDIFVDSGVLPRFKIKEMVLMSFLTAVASHYQDNPYHNFLHAVYVLHGVWMVLLTTEARKGLAGHDVLALLISSICHDIDHDGKNNQFHINTNSELAQRYNDISVQENHHCAITFAVLAKRECKILANVEPALQKEIRKMIISNLMATDMSSHFALASEFLKKTKIIDIDDENARTLLAKFILHCVDISNPVHCLEVGHCMSQRVIKEFKQQAARERELGLPVAPHMDFKTEVMEYQSEVNFIDYICMPMWKSLAKLLPPLEICVAQMKRNRDSFVQLAEDAKLGKRRIQTETSESSSVIGKGRISTSTPEMLPVESHEKTQPPRVTQQASDISVGEVELTCSIDAEIPPRDGDHVEDNPPHTET
ncbi:hypothetical protein BSKO_01010 [Bryopsis sp. KO-2023]|nr:hypothetical protein BSKO_01010 [Bryopsis sp. KO-2023]